MLLPWDFVGSKMFKIILILVLVLLINSCGGGGNSGETQSDYQFDASVSNFTIPNTVDTTSTINTSVTAQNSGPQNAVGMIGIYLSADENIDIKEDTLLKFSLSTIQTTTPSNYDISFTLPNQLASGTYYIAAVMVPLDASQDTNPDNNTVSKSIQVSGTDCIDDANEKDDTLATAVRLNLNNSHAHNFCRDDSDWTVVSMTQGTEYNIYLSDFNDSLSGPEPFSLIYNASGELLYPLEGDINGFPPAKIKWTAPTSGDYYIRVRPFFGMLDAGSGTEYTLSVSNLDVDLKRQITSPSSLTKIAGDAMKMSFFLANDGDQTSTASYAEFYLSDDEILDDSDIPMGTYHFPAVAAKGSEFKTIVLAVPEVSAGNYKLITVVDAGDEVTEYNELNNFSVEDFTVQAPPARNCQADTFEGDDSYVFANPLIINTPQTHNFCDDQVDWVKFDVIKDQVYFVSVRSINASSIIPDLGLYTADNQLIHFLNTTPVQFEFTASETGTLFLMIDTTGNSPTGAGEYEVNVSDVAM